MQDKNLESIRRQKEFERRVQKQHVETMAEKSEIKNGIATLL